MPPERKTTVIHQNPHKSSVGWVLYAVTHLQDSFGTHESPDAMRVLNDYNAVYILDGSVRYRDVNGADRRLRKGDLFFVLPGLAHAYSPEPGETWGQIWIAFNGPMFDLWQREGMIDADHLFHRIEPVEYWFGRLCALFTENQPEIPDQARASCALLGLFAEVFAYERASEIGREDRMWLAQARKLFEPQVVGARMDASFPQEVARAMHMSYTNFRKKFTRLSGDAPGRYRMHVLMQRACRLIIERNLSNKELSERIGLGDEFQFSRRFKQVVGLTPSEFRRRAPGRS